MVKFVFQTDDHEAKNLLFSLLHFPQTKVKKNFCMQQTHKMFGTHFATVSSIPTKYFHKKVFLTKLMSCARALNI